MARRLGGPQASARPAAAGQLFRRVHTLSRSSRAAAEQSSSGRSRSAYSSGMTTAGSLLSDSSMRALEPRMALMYAVKLEAMAIFSGAIIQLMRSEEHTSELQSLMRLSYAVFCLQTKTT